MSDVRCFTIDQVVEKRAQPSIPANLHMLTENGRSRRKYWFHVAVQVRRCQESRPWQMGGEPIPSSEVSRWTQAERIIGIYGPAECTPALSIVLLSAKTRSQHVGNSFNARTWLVEPDRPDRLAAIGIIGELLVEGPTISTGYFNSPNQTTAAFIHNPSWLLQGAPRHPGSTRR